MSGGHFAEILTSLTCRGFKGQSPLASLGTAQRLSPVQSGLPLCETCLSSPHHWASTIQASFPTTLKNFHSRWQWFCDAGTDCWRIEKLLFPQAFSFWNRLVMHHSDAKYRKIMCRIRHPISFLCLLVQLSHLPTPFCHIFLFFLPFFFWITFHFCWKA